MKDKEVNPVAITVGIVLILLVAGGIWFFTSNQVGGPAPGAAGRADPMLSGPNNILSRNMRRPGATGGNQTPPTASPGSPPGSPPAPPR